MLSLADTSIRLYRKKNGLVSLRLKSYLLVHSNVGFSLDAYLRNLSCQLTISSGQVVPMEYSFTIHTQAEHILDTMLHSFWAWGEVEMESMRNSLGKLRVDYHISFTGHPYEKPDFFEMIVPLIVKTRKYKGL
jgi:hypothetical protein